MDTATQLTPGETTGTPDGFFARLHAFREQHAKKEIALFFTAGFLFDVFTLDRIDSVLTLAQQGGYLVMLLGLLLYEQRHELKLARPGKWVERAWRFSEDALHFLLGSLLSSFSLFYFKSASGIAALGFLGFTFAVLVANELPRFRRLGHVVRVGLFAFCVTSFLSYVVPIAFGFLSPWLFLLAASLSAAVGYGVFHWVRRWGGNPWAMRRIGAPYGGVVGVMLGAYFLGAVPPIPVHAEKLGIYHEVTAEKLEGGKREYLLLHQRPWWKVWQRGDQTFHARPGDRAYVFVSVFAPTKFADQVRVKWRYKDVKRGWVDQGPGTLLSVVGGRDQGFRTFAYNSDPRPGKWEAQVLTDDGRVIGEIGMTVLEDPSTEPRTFLEERY
ncbi:MAG: DUF2914 domain-containing protein [Myxococcota bacterium]